MKIYIQFNTSAAAFFIATTISYFMIINGIAVWFAQISRICTIHAFCNKVIG